MFGDGALAFREFAMHEKLPLATIHEAVLEFLRGRNDAVVFGAQAVNAYVDEPRMTQDVAVLSPRASELAEEIRSFLHERYQIAVRVRRVKDGLGFRIYQVREPKNRHLVDVRCVHSLPPTQRVDGVLVLTPVELICTKILSMASRPRTAKGLIDEADVMRLLLTFPELKSDPALVRERLRATGADQAILASWDEIATQEILPEEDEGF